MRGFENYHKAQFESANILDFPDIQPFKEVITIDKWLDFETARNFRGNRKKCGVHFFLDDYKFQNVWNSPDRYIDMFKGFGCIIMSDYSLYYNFPFPLQVYNKYRNHWLACYYASFGVKVIPNISLSTPVCYDWSFLGYPKSSVVAFSDIGTNKDKVSKEIINLAYDEMLKALEPTQIIYFTRSKTQAPKECTVIELPYIRSENNG